MGAGQDADVAEAVLGQPVAVVTLVAGSLVLGAAGFAVARWRRWPAIPAVLAGCGLALALAVTLARTGGSFTLVTTDPVGRCVGNVGFSLAGSWERLNVVMLVPFAFFATVACRRPFAVLSVSGLVSGAVELTQAATGIGVCEAQDFSNNTIGALVAALVAWLVAALVAWLVTAVARPAGRGGRAPDLSRRA
ncbi:VanZ family protein [Saccharothrix isguenensis]